MDFLDSFHADRAGRGLDELGGGEARGR
jgi:hypothetical protein